MKCMSPLVRDRFAKADSRKERSLTKTEEKKEKKRSTKIRETEGLPEAIGTNRTSAAAFRDELCIKRKKWKNRGCPKTIRT